MNILVLSWRGPGHPHAGGAEVVTHEHAKAWVKAGHKVTLFTSSFVGGKNEEVIDGINVVREGYQVFGVQFKAFFWYLRNKNFDLVIDHFHGIPFFTPLYVKSKKVAFIHEVTKEIWKLNPWPKPLNLIPYFIGTLFEPSVFKIYKNLKFITVSSSTKKDLIDWGIKVGNIEVIHNGVNLLKPKKKLVKDKNKTIIYLGALSADKGINEAIDCFKQVSVLDQDVKFWIAGKGEDNLVKQLKSKIKDYGLEKKVKLFGFVSESKKFDLLSRAHILINPSHREGWGLVVIEAASVGTPTVGFDVAGLRDSVVSGKTGILCKMSDVDGLARNITQLMSNEKKYKKMSDEAMKWSKNFNWERSTKKSLKFIENL